MSVARLYANENFPRQVVEHLRRLGHDAQLLRVNRPSM